MVDWYGRWRYEPDTPEEKKCDSDRVADWIIASGYISKTSIEHLVDMIFLMFDSPDEQHNDVFNLEEVKDYVEACGGLEEFDYYP